MADFEQSSSRGVRIALYSPGIVGLGHLRRNLIIAQTLANSLLRPTTLMITEAREASGFIETMPSDVDCMTLPGLSKGVDSICQPRCLKLSLNEIIGFRAKIICTAVQAFQPHLFIVDNLPRGAYGELNPTLRYLRTHRETRLILGLRDVLDEPSVVQWDWQRWQNEDAIRDHYDSIWVYGDPAIYDMRSEYNLPESVSCKVHFVGYIDQRARTRFAENFHGLEVLLKQEVSVILCLVGGGQDGERLAMAFCQATLPANAAGLLITGPFMSPKSQRELEEISKLTNRVRIVKFIPEPTLLFPHVDQVIGMGGYNTICEVLSFQKRALIVPRVRPRREQIIRAERLQKMGLLDLLHPDHLTPQALSDWMQRDSPPFPSHNIDLNGLNRLPTLAAQLLDNSALNSMNQSFNSYPASARIGYVLKMFPRLSETFILNEILEMERQGMDLQIFSLKRPADSVFHAQAKLVRSPIVYLPENIFLEPIGILRSQWYVFRKFPYEYGRALSDLFRGGGIGFRTSVMRFVQACCLIHEMRDVAHLHVHYATIPAKIAFVIQRITGMSYSITTHAKDIFQNAQVTSFKLQKRIRQARFVVANSDYSAQALKSYVPDYGEIHTIFNGIDLDSFCERTTQPAEPLILSVGRLVEKKGFLDLIEACSLLKERQIVFKCELVGTGELSETIKERIVKSGLQQHVKMIGPLPQQELRKSYERAMIFALPCIEAADGDRDILPNVIKEAMATGLPVVTTDLTAIKELIEDRVTGILVPPKNPAALAESLASLLSNQELRDAIALRTRLVIEQRFDRRITFCKLKTLLIQAVQSATAQS